MFPDTFCFSEFSSESELSFFKVSPCNVVGCLLKTQLANFFVGVIISIMNPWDILVTPWAYVDMLTLSR